MGYISIQINKAKGSADTGASDHIERKTTPKNADPTRTHLNRELVEFPDGVADRTEAISHRIRTAGIKRKITPDQVRAIRIVLSGTHEDMARVQDEGRLNEWCGDNLQWLHRTFAHVRKGEHRIGSAAHGRAHAAYSCNGCADSNGRAQESEEEAGGGQTHLPQESQRRAFVC